jgi:hypothetical protein
VPKRGGPKEEESDINKELNNLILDDNKPEEAKKMGDNLQQTEKPHEQIRADIRQDDIININYKSKDELNTKDEPFIAKEETKPKEIPKLSKEETKPKDIPHVSKEELKPKDKPSIAKDELKSIPKKEEDKNPHLSREFISPPKNLKIQKVNLTQSMLSDDYLIDPSVKKLDYKLPVKFKTPDYFRLTDTIKKELDHAQRELNSNKIEKALNMAELALFYLNNIKV